ncbi:MAG: FAD-dependent oxidoreductase [Anaerohalosphaeraceae bacterium]|nr:FAD-dependent oxidoreductase [Anaerohalosphaeraceae bacterium]
MKKTDVLVIGGSAAGIVTAITAKSNYPKKSVLLIRKEEQVLVPCGIPYIFGSLDSIEKNIIPDAGLSKAGVDLMVGQAVEINQSEKTCLLKDGTTISFEKLVLATGSSPSVPKWLKGADLDNVFVIPKDKEYISKVLDKINSFKKIITVGAGFIGVEISDELNKRDKDVTLVEILPNILGLAFDKEFATIAEGLLQERGVHLKTSSGVKEIIGNGKVSGVLLNNSETIEADAVILSMGYTPNTVLAKEAGLNITDKGFVAVDEYMRTENSDIFAVGDCAEKRDFITRKHSGVMLASTACAEARVAGMNLYKLSTLKVLSGTIAIFSTAIGGTGFGAAGLTEETAKKEGFDVVTGSFEGVDKHPGALSDTHKQFMKLIVAKESGVVLGGEVAGGLSVGELTNLIGIIIQNRMSINSILTAQIGTHPLLTGPPTAYPLIKAAEVIAKNL